MKLKASHLTLANRKAEMLWHLINMYHLIKIEVIKAH